MLGICISISRMEDGARVDLPLIDLRPSDVNLPLFEILYGLNSCSTLPTVIG